MRNLILASSSRYRQAQLAALGVNAEAIAADIDESPFPEEKPDVLAARLAAAKASKVSALKPEAIVIGSDQVACLNSPDGRHILGKPGCHSKAVKQLSLCQGRSVIFYSALSLACKSSGKQVTETDITTVHFTTLSQRQIEDYLRAETPYDCAGSFKSEGKGVLLFDAIESRDPNALIGLPVMLLRDLLIHFEVDLLALATANLSNAAAT
ncbi:septum formation protein Maf [Alteromonas pelagimontana]|uniref:7-methyl-GTP pyrophosphatase n=1 Tax=Alteromonas pelagimontana TaxID=1858656 RepID=A0A6M4MBC3_9ALTE|nr:Maf family nucleotide pyrophosphatase [Alteromonas pelagimontana]QJR79456.1 septum formation protein Maf [Alteromonas pelagimontana]